jgi:hypothetical protein
MWRQGFNPTDISRDVNVFSDRSQVSRWIKKFKKAEAEGVADEEAVLSQPRSGRPTTATTPVIKKKVLKHVKDKRKRSLRKTSAWLKKKGIEASYEAVRRILLKHNLYPYRRKKQPFLIKSQKQKRVKFAKKFKDHDWMNTLMTDEKDFNLFAATNPQNDRVWTDDPEKVPPVELVGHASGVKVWAGVSATGKTNLHFYTGTIATTQYLKILKKAKAEMNACFDNDDWTFQHDGASAHKAKKTNEWLEENVPNFITSGPTGAWPAKSPDFNFIENVWAIMEEKLEENPPKTTPSLKRRLRKIWRDFPQSTLEKMAKGMKNRLKDAIAKKGGCIGK